MNLNGRQLPWRSTPLIYCRICGEQATRVLTASTAERFNAMFPDKDEQPVAVPDSASEKVTVYTCTAHEQRVGGDLCDRYGGSMGDSIEPTPWRYWLASFWWRPYNAAVLRMPKEWKP